MNKLELNYDYNKNINILFLALSLVLVFIIVSVVRDVNLWQFSCIAPSKILNFIGLLYSHNNFW